MENSTNSDFEPMINIHKLVGSGVKHYTTAIQKKNLTTTAGMVENGKFH